MDAITLLIEDHKEVEDLFTLFEDSESDIEREGYARKICKALTVHTKLEEELFYPEARKVFDDKDDKLVDEAEHEHALAKKLINDIKGLKAGLRLTAEMKALKLAIEHHVEEEETEMFPKLEKLGMETSLLGVKMSKRKLELEQLTR